jgi:uncharacterized membrane protein YkoI
LEEYAIHVMFSLSCIKQAQQIRDVCGMTIKSIIVALMLAFSALPSAAQTLLDDLPELDDEPRMEMAQEDGGQITPSEAAAIAQDAVPGAKVLKVKLLSSGDYAVTLRVKGSVMRVMVNSQDGSIQ